MMMKWGWDFNRELRDSRNEVVQTKASRLIRGSDDVDGDNGLNITVRRAIGGKIVTFRHYDHKTDRHQHRLYVIPEDHDFERELGKLITLESLKG
jgi:hypothetical protein